MALPDSDRNSLEAALGGADAGHASPANVAPCGAQSLDAKGHDDARTRTRALVLESADGLMLASELVADETARASLTRYADELVAWSEACASALRKPSPDPAIKP